MWLICYSCFSEYDLEEVVAGQLCEECRSGYLFKVWSFYV